MCNFFFKLQVTGGKQYSDIRTGFSSIIKTLKQYFVYRVSVANSAATGQATDAISITQMWMALYHIQSSNKNSTATTKWTSPPYLRWSCHAWTSEDAHVHAELRCRQKTSLWCDCSGLEYGDAQWWYGINVIGRHRHKHQTFQDASQLHSWRQGQLHVRCHTDCWLCQEWTPGNVHQHCRFRPQKK